jgi:F0F1-type ATP synthase delta subunit
MSGNPLTEKVAVPYARALFDFSVEKNIMHQITADFQNLDIFFNESNELLIYLNNPIINQKSKREVLAKTLKSQLNIETFKSKERAATLINETINKLEGDLL